jgi:VCBS repeat-containing protein
MTNPFSAFFRLLFNLGATLLWFWLALFSGAAWAQALITMTAAPDPVLAGQKVLYTITVNNRDSLTRSFTVVATVPPSTTVDRADTSPVATDSVGNAFTTLGPGAILRFTTGNIAPGESNVLRFSARVADATSAGTALTTSATATSNVGVVVTAGAAPVVAAAPGLRLSLADAPSTVPASGTLDYVLTYGNAGAAASDGLTPLTMPLPAGTTLVEASDGGTLIGGTVQWDIGALAPGEFNRRQLRVRVGPNPPIADGTLIEASAQIAGQTRAGTTSHVIAAPEAAIDMSAAPDPVLPGQKVLYTITVSNRETVLRSFTVTVPVPAHTTVARADTSPLATDAVGNAFTTLNPGQILRFVTGNVPAGESAVLRFSALVDVISPPPAGTVIEASAAAFNNNTGSDVQTSHALVVGAAPGLRLSLADAPSTVPASGTLDYVLTYGNAGGAPVPARLLMPLPLGVQAGSAIASDGGVVAGNLVQWDLGTLPAGAFGQRRLSVQVGPNPPTVDGTLIGAAASLREATSGDGLAQADTTSHVIAAPEAAIDMSAAPDPVLPGQKVLYTITVSNRETVLRSFTVTVPVPAHTTVARADTSPLATDAVGNAFTTLNPGQILRFVTGNVPAGESAVLRFSALVDVISPPPAGTVIEASAAAFNNNTGSDVETKVAVSYPLGATQFNNAPVAQDDGFATDRDVPLVVAAPGVLGNDSDVESQVLTAQLVGAPAVGTLSLAADGSFTYTPPAGFVGGVTFTYRASDGQTTNNLSNLATVSIAVNGVNRAPGAVNDAFTTNEDTPLNVGVPGVLGNDSDPDGNPLTAVLETGPAVGTLTLNANGSFSYTPPANFNGPVSFTYRASDGALVSDPATVTITVTAVNDAPVAINDSYSTPFQTALTIAAPGVLGNDTDVEGNPLAAVLGTGPANGTLTLSANGAFIYTPNAGFSGSDSFTYRANDGQAANNLSGLATVTIAVGAPTNRAPVAVGDTFVIIEDTPLNVGVPGVLGNDSDPDGNPLTAVLETGPAVGTLTLNANGSFSYVPPLNFNGPVTFTYRASDGALTSAPATVAITVNGLNDAPVAVNDAFATNEDTPLNVGVPGVLGNDTDVDGNPLSAVLEAGPAVGTLTLVANGGFSYVPPLNFNGPVSFTYRASDGTLVSAPATVTITVTAVNDAPVAVNDSYSTPFQTALTTAAPGVLGNDTDVEGNTLAAVLGTGPANGTLTLNANGAFIYTPNAGFSGSDSFTYRANDGQAANNLSGLATVTIAVGAQVNLAPVANAGPDQTVRVSSLTTLDGRGSNDPDGFPAPLTFAWVQSAGPASVALNGAGTARPSFTPALAGLYVFTLTVNDGAATATDTVQIRVPLRGDIDLDGDVDLADVNLLIAARNAAASGPNDIRDLNADGRVDGLDARIDATLCTRPRCATQ